MYLAAYSLGMAEPVLKPQCGPKSGPVAALGASVTLPPSADPMRSCRVAKGRWDFPDPPHPAETLPQCGKGELINKQTIWYRIRIFGDDHHMDVCRMETPIIKSRSYFMRKWKLLFPKYRSGTPILLH
jgi:hypothetical protein